MNKNNNSTQIPQLICLEKPSKGRNNGYYEVTIPTAFMPQGKGCLGAYQVYRFVGLKYGGVK